jgi:hypothetical protein
MQQILIPMPEQLLDVIHGYLQRTGMAASRFGSLVCGDPNLVTDIEDGRVPGLALARDILGAIERFPDGIPMPNADPKKNDWTATENRILVQLWGMGLSHIRISEIMGRSPSAVVGRAHRRGLPRRNRINGDVSLSETLPSVGAQSLKAPCPAAPVQDGGADDDLFLVRTERRKERRCLFCTGWFLSEHFGNRICDPCKGGRDTDVESYSIKGAHF